MCELCDKIYPGDDGWHWTDKKSHIIIKEKSGDLCLYSNVDDDYYIDQTALKITFCPVCGRKLVK